MDDETREKFHDLQREIDNRIEGVNKKIDGLYKAIEKEHVEQRKDLSSAVSSLRKFFTWGIGIIGIALGILWQQIGVLSHDVHVHLEDNGHVATKVALENIEYLLDKLICAVANNLC